MIENPTRHKAKEAEFHLLQSKEHYQEDDEFSYFLSAFLSAARSITFYMQKQYGKHSGFPKWYCEEQTRMVADADLKYLNEARVEDVHQKPVHTGATRAVSFSTIDEPISLQSKKIADFVNNGNCLSDPICRRFCLHCTKNFNVAANQIRENVGE